MFAPLKVEKDHDSDDDSDDAVPVRNIAATNEKFRHSLGGNSVKKKVDIQVDLAMAQHVKTLIDSLNAKQNVAQHFNVATPNFAEKKRARSHGAATGSQDPIGGGIK